ncbi:hypothetical protein HY004_00660 [Candidatus Saccharibacteria bacterium]|nr:hypothetical protein [Candidatus Saccharibacteria bacterium]
MTKNIHFDFDHSTTPQYEGEVTIGPLEDEDTEYHDALPSMFTQVTTLEEPERSLLLRREHWHGKNWFITTSLNGLSEVICKVDPKLDPKPTDEDVARAMLAAVYTDRAD